MQFWRLFSLMLVVLCLTSFSSEAHAKKGFWEALFAPWLEQADTGPKPEDTLEAPFADHRKYGEGEHETLAKLKKLQGGGNPEIAALRLPHVDHPEIAQWLMSVVPEALTYDVNEAPAMAEKRRANFTEGGWNQLKGFRMQNGFPKVEDTKKFNIHSFVKTEPLLLNALEHKGRYRWLYEVPVMVSVVGADEFNYKKDDPVNQEFVIRVQVGRVLERDHPKGVLIENWDAQSLKESEKR